MTSRVAVPVPDVAQPARRSAPAAGVRSPRPASDAACEHNGPARVAAFGGLGALLASVAIIAATTLGGAPARSAAVGVRAGPAAGGHPRVWTVRPGQTLSSIAGRESVSVGELERLNPRLVPSGLAAGQRVRLPA